MRILIVHEVDYSNKPVFEFQMLAEILSVLGHEVIVIDYPQGKLTIHFERHPILRAWVAHNVHRAYKDASLTIMRPFPSELPALTRLSYVLNIGKLLKEIIGSQEIDFILLYSVPHSGWQTIKLARNYNIPVVFRSIDALHQIVPNKIYQYLVKILEKYVYRNSDLILALTPKLMNYTIQLGANPSRVKLQLTGADTNLFKPLSKNLNLAEKWGFKQYDKIVLFAGTLYKFSNLDWLAEHWGQVLKEIPEAKLLILGKGPLFKKLKAIIKKNDLEKNIILTDWQPYELLPDFINLADICINIFQLNDITRDIIPSKLFQYLACAKPVIISPLPGTRDILIGGENGVVYAKDNFDALGLIIKVLKNKSEARKIGQNGYNLVKEKYNWQKITENILKEIKDRFKIRD